MHRLNKLSLHLQSFNAKFMDYKANGMPDKDRFIVALRDVWCTFNLSTQDISLRVLNSYG
jgi:hypothetical protein